MKRAPSHYYHVRIPLDLWDFLKKYSKKNNRDVSIVVIDRLYDFKNKIEKSKKSVDCNVP